MALQNLPVYIILTVIFFATLALRRLLVSFITNNDSYPPGPPVRWPFIGPIIDSSTPQWITYTQWGKQYGDLYHFRLYGQHYFIINSEKVANDLLESRSRIYSDKPKSTILDLIGWDFAVGIMPYGDWWRRCRRMFHQNFRATAAARYRPTQMRRLHEMMRHLQSSPEEFSAHIKTFATSIVMLTVYGCEVKDSNDRFVYLAERTMAKLSDSILPGSAIVDSIPILRYLPEWFPGAAFQREARMCRENIREMQDVPFSLVCENLASTNTPDTSMVARLLESNATRKAPRDQERAIKQVAATALAAGADTTVSTLKTFFLAMVLYPDVQKKAQQEIDHVVGGDRLPNYIDRDSLPYIEAVYREVMRWRPVLPLSLARTAITDDVYNGYLIPKGAIILTNIWAMTRNEAKYADPESFNPERFFTPDDQLNNDRTILGFGFGRRICIGRHMADATVWATIVSVLAVFNISQAVDEFGKKIAVSIEYSDGGIIHPKPFHCSILPRSDNARKLILSTDIVLEES